MPRIIIGLLVILFQGSLLAQGPRVPHKMTLGDVRLKITDGARAEIQKNVDELTKHPKYFNAKVNLANQYFHFIEEAFRKEGIPEDIKYLVIQESGLISDVVSTSNAVGYWQFKDFTAVEMGLRIDRYVDERKNIYAASIGAAKYMKMNNGYFDNWIYAIQAYQMGAGGALKVTDKKLYGAKQMTITKNTYWYVKKYIAHKVAYQGAVGKSRPSIYLSAYKSGAGKSLHEIAKKFEVNEEELVKYNKWLKKGKVPSDKKYVVIIPDKKLLKIADDSDASAKPKSIVVKKAPTYNQTQAKLFPTIKPWKGSNNYSRNTVNVNRLPGIIGVEGSKLTELVRNGNVSLTEFLSINDIKINHRVIVGVPYYFKKKKKKAKVYYHIVQSRETLWSISQKYGVQLKKLLMKNRLTENIAVKEGRVVWMRHIRPENIPIAYEEIDDSKPVEIAIETNENQHINDSDKLRYVELPEIDSAEETTPIDELEHEEMIDSVKYKKLIHVVKKGDTYYNIANRYAVQVLELVRWNKLTLADKLSIEQQLIVIVAKTDQQLGVIGIDELRNSVEYHVVKKGETLYSISIKYGFTIEELKLINNKGDVDVAIGEQLKVSRNK